jgi:hypothetical protein
MGGPCSTNGGERERGRGGTLIDYWWESQMEMDH